jgi:hypothetical protein
MAYKITEYTKQQAKKLGVEVRPSLVKGKKVAVIKNGKKVADVGAIGYMDYPTYLDLETKGKYPKGYANFRRRQYKIRHDKDRRVPFSNGFYADKLLW